MYDRWWKTGEGTGQCDGDDKGKKNANALAIANVGGIFVVLVIGLGLAFIVGILEFVWKAHKNSDEDKVRVKQYFPCFFFSPSPSLKEESCMSAKVSGEYNRNYHRVLCV